MANYIENETVKNLIADLEKRVEEHILEPNNLEFLKKLLSKAESEDEAISICKLGTTFYKTGLIFDKKLEVPSDGIYIFNKNEKLSFDGNGTKNKLIIGDNYYALLNLLVEHRGKIDVIYIDPPYGANNLGEFAHTNYENQINRDNLLSMLQSRLMIALQLLSDTGVIFCSIDDKNYAYIKCLFDEVFGERNYLATFHWMKTATPPSLSPNVRKKFEYVLCYKKYQMDGGLSGGVVSGGDMPLLNDGNRVISVVVPKENIICKIPDGVYPAGQYDRVELEESFAVREGMPVDDLHIKGPMKWTQETILKEASEGTAFYIKSTKFAIRYARSGDRIKTPSNIISKDECGVGTNEEATKELDSIFGKKMFDFPKPSSLIEYLVNMQTYDKKDAVVLDFFAGSGTTGQAVMNLNKKDGGNRSFILVQLPETLATDTKSDTVKNQIELLDSYGLPHNLAYITADRLRRVIKGEGYDGRNNYDWIKKNKKFDGSLEVLEMTEYSIYDHSIFDKIDETLYGHEKFNNIKEKIEWVCTNFEKVARKLKDASRN